MTRASANGPEHVVDSGWRALTHQAVGHAWDAVGAEARLARSLVGAVERFMQRPKNGT